MNVNQTTKHIEKKITFVALTQITGIRFNLYSEDYAVLFYIWLFNFCTWILLDLPEKYKALFI